MDFFGDALSASPEPRLYEAYGELSGVLFGGDLLAGQTFSTFADMSAWPDILDFEGPPNTIASRQPLVRICASRISSWFQPVFMLYVPLECQRSGRRGS